MKNIIINGASYIHGFDICYDEFGSDYKLEWNDWFTKLTDAQKDRFNEVRLSGQLASKLKTKVTDLSHYGVPNEYICNKTIDYLEKNKNNINAENTLVIIGWTENQRFSLFSNNTRINVNPYSITGYLKCAEEMLNSDNSEFIRLYKLLMPLEELYNTTKNIAIGPYLDHLQNINYLQLYLDRHNFNYCFFNTADQYPFYDRNIKDVIGYDPDYLVDWNRWLFGNTKETYWKSWQDTILNDKKMLTNTNHPSILAAQDLSNKLIDYFGTQLK